MLADEYGTASNIKSRVNRWVAAGARARARARTDAHICIVRHAPSLFHSFVCRLSVLGAITSTQQKLKLYNRIPDNGLVLYCGTILTDDGKEKRVNIDFEPFKPINTSLYLCDNKFHTEVRVTQRTTPPTPLMERRFSHSPPHVPFPPSWQGVE